jgi:hypothetical protein
MASKDVAWAKTGASMASTAASFAKTYDLLPQLAGTGDVVEMELGVRQGRKIVAASAC